MNKVDSFIEFLESFKSSESLSPDLRDDISIPTKLDELIISIANKQRLILITGTAGSGKTHLLHGLQKKSKIKIIGLPENAKDKHILVIPDATVLSPKERINTINKMDDKREATIIAINEGPLREMASLKDANNYKIAQDLLQRGRQGEKLVYHPEHPTIIDMDAFDPIEREVIIHILSLPILDQVLEHRSCSCPDDVCPRLTAWSQLKEKTIRERIGRLLKMVLLTKSDWTFRDVWDFVADLILGGDCDSDPPTSPWFWRLFYGSSTLSNVLKITIDPVTIALPTIDQRLWYGDWASTFLEPLDETEMLIISA